VLIEFIEAKKEDPKYKWRENIDELTLQRLAGAGLLTGPSTALEGTTIFETNEYGESFVKFGIAENG